MPDTGHSLRWLLVETRCLGDFGHERGRVDAKTPHILRIQHAIAALIDRAGRDEPAIDLLDHPNAVMAFAGITDIPFLGARFLNEEPAIQQPLEVFPKIRFCLPPPQDRGFTRLTQLQQQPGQVRGHAQIHCDARAS